MNQLMALLSNIPNLVLALLGVGFLIFFHELGHFFFAKLFGVRTPSFSIGFGPRLIEKKLGDTTFTLSAIPLGGYVEMAGSPEVGQGEQQFAHATDSSSLASKPYWQKMCIIGGGIAFNILFCYLVLIGLFYTGAPCIGSWCKDKPALIGAVMPGSSAEKAGLKSGDYIVGINGQPVKTIQNLTETLTPLIDQQTTLSIRRGTDIESKDLTVASQSVGEKKLPRLGVFWAIKPMGFIDACKESVLITWSLIQQVCSALTHINKDSLSGPLMLFSEVGKTASLGFKVFLFMLAFISVNLAVFNLIPLPIFDGGQAVFYTIEAIIGRTLSENIREKIAIFNWILIIALTLYLTYKDLLKIIGW